MSETPYCPDCGRPMGEAGWSEDLCPECLLQLALAESSGPVDEPGSAVATPALGTGPPPFSRGKILGNRYGLRRFLGRGGMGEVWQAYDLKLRVDVALKTVRPELAVEARILETLRQEVRAAREVVSPNVCRVHDLQEFSGRELVSMEYVDGTTLRALLENRGPIELQEAREIAAQFLAGLDAIHQAGLVHRDIKPENLMITRTGRVVVMDFGIAKGLARGGAGTVAGTPAYMAPEQERGEAVDPRADVFSAGVVLAEMVARDGVGSRAAREALWRGVRQQPPELPESPWREVIEVAVAHRAEQRYAAASALARALEDVTIRVEGAEDVRPYPGLLAFIEQTREYFFGRELEAEALWKKIRRLHLLALVGPSGAGKTSFLRAGLLGNEPAGWAHVICTPGEAPLTALRQALVPQLSGDSDAMRELVKLEDPEAMVSAVSRWRGRSKHALLVVDQFEELFTLNPPDVQETFTALLGRLAVDADLHVLLSLRDDFLIRCNAFEALGPILSELTLLGPPMGAALRRAIVQPALKCGYRFEDEELVERMLSEVEGERGVLPLVAFAAEQLWERRDKTQGVLTQEAYEVIGGVGGALAQHAELTLERIGTGRSPVVRELFRNLTTGEGTRAVRDREELLSVFPEGTGRDAAAEVLDALIDARLLTSYGAEATEDHENAQRVEIVHESLLTAWPRLVRWQAQDVEGAKMRDDLRQAARRWQERDRPDDLLWAGSAYRELQVWRERYPGALSETEEAFFEAMADHATRGRRRKGLLVIVAFALLAAVTGAIAVSRNEALRARGVAEDQARRAEASKLLALAQVALEGDPTEALAYATASLELADTPEGRLFALRALAEGPPALELDPQGVWARIPTFSPDGRRLAVAGHGQEVGVWTDDGTGPVRLGGHEMSELGSNVAGWASDRLLVTGLGVATDRVHVWSLPDGERLKTMELGGPSRWSVGAGRLLAETRDEEDGARLLRSWRLPDGDPETLAQIDTANLGAVTTSTFAPDGQAWLYAAGRDLRQRSLRGDNVAEDRLLDRHPTDIEQLWPFSRGGFFSRDREGEVHLHAADAGPPVVLRHPPKAPKVTWPSPSGRWLLADTWLDKEARLWDTQAWAEARPLRFRRNASWRAANEEFDPSGRWLVISTHDMGRLTFWPLADAHPIVVDGYHGPFARPLAFSPDGRLLATCWAEDEVRVWPAPGSDEGAVRSVRLEEGGALSQLVFDPKGRYVFGVGVVGRVYIIPLDGSPAQRLQGVRDDKELTAVAVSPSGRRVAGAPSFGDGKALYVWDAETGRPSRFPLPEPPLVAGSAAEGSQRTGLEGGVFALHFVDDRTLLSAGHGGVRRWDVESGSHELLIPAEGANYANLIVSGDGTAAQLVSFDPPGAVSSVRMLDLSSGELGELVNPPLGLPPVTASPALDATGTIVALGHGDGLVSLRRFDATGPSHLLPGHAGSVSAVALSPDGRWIASSGEDRTLRLWPMPDLGRPPLHALRHDELLARLKSSTNLRAVAKEDSSTGWTIELGPFPGWEDVPTW